MGNNSRGFSLAELLVVLAISALLAGLIMPVIRRAREEGLITRTRATIAAVEAALYLYESDYGDYPAYHGTAGEVVLLLTSDSQPSLRWRGPYLRFKEEQIRTGELVDPWGNPYHYHYPQARYASTPFLLYSSGPDRVKDTDRDIGNW